MRSKTISVTDEAQAHDREFHAIFSAARQARTRLSIRPHRAITPLSVTSYLMSQAIVLPIVLCGLIVWFKPVLFDFWRQCIFFWSSGLHLPFSLSTRINEAGQYGLQLSGDLDGGQLPNATTLAVTALPELLFPPKGRYGLQDYEKAFCALDDDKLNIFNMRGINKHSGCLVVVRPDQYIAHVLPLNDTAALAEFFAGFMLNAMN